MTVIQLTDTYLKLVKRALREQCDAGSVHITEAIARGCGFTTQAGLRNALQGHAEGSYVRFSEHKFRKRLAELSGGAGPDRIALPPIGHSARYIVELFDEAAIEILEMHPARARFRLAGIETVIRIDLTDLGNGYWQFERSHAIHTPEQAGPYWPGRTFDDDPAYAMHRAIDSIVDYYRYAVKEGHQPHHSWLKPSAT
ncbi:hypothetical protein N185_17230 [Sinorhizobium sp. GW3]|nr:hypothetical protein N185_17230 [Sinorhizobium sp. GW3]